MSGKIAAKNGVLLVAGYNISTDALDYSFEDKVDELEVTGLSDGAHNFIPGQRAASLTCNMLWDSTASKANDVLKPMVGATTTTANYVTLLPEGGTVGNASLSLPFHLVNWNPGGSPADALKVGAVKFMSRSNNDGVERGDILQHGTITNTTNGTAVADIGGADVTAICGATLHIWSATSTDTYVIKVQHSTNGSTSWSDILTFSANGTAITAERQTAASATVKTYRRIVATRTGSAGDTLGFTVTFYRI